ncbi:hypothetical protein TNCV_1332481 [Trichonephila clavipes]|nr:hypothetical protein TNCV_1332481 [Trichonephila clavipes]
MFKGQSGRCAAASQLHRLKFASILFPIRFPSSVLEIQKARKESFSNSEPTSVNSKDRSPSRALPPLIGGQHICAWLLRSHSHSIGACEQFCGTYDLSSNTGL